MIQRLVLNPGRRSGVLFKTNPVNLRELIEDVHTGKIQLPDFQRPWVWDDDRIGALLATVARGYPLGVMMTLETGGSGLRFRPKPLEGVHLPGPMEPEQLLMDGQQRLTSLSQALASGQPVKTMDASRRKLLRWYYIDIACAVDRPEDMEEAIISVPVDQKLSVTDGPGIRRVIDLTTRDGEVDAGLYPLRLIYVSEGSMEPSDWRSAYESENRDRWHLFERRILDEIKNYQVPVIQLTKDASKQAICSVFENVNTRGVVLTVFQLLTASYAANATYEREHGQYFHLPGDWAALRARLAAFNAVAEFDDTDFLRAICLVSTHHLRRGLPDMDAFLQPAASCSRNDILSLELTEYLRWAPEIESALEWCADFLDQQGVFTARGLPYRSQVSALAAIRAVLGSESESDEASRKIARWFWCGVLGEQYSGSPNSRLPRDLEQVIGWVNGGLEPTSVAEATFSAARLDTLTTRNSAAYKGVCALLLSQECIDWTYSRDPIDATISRELQVDFGRVFPRIWSLQVKGTESDLVDSIVNKTAMTARTNRVLAARPPAEYLRQLESEVGLPGSWMDDLVATHLIDPKTLRENDFPAFYASRKDKLLRLIEKVTGIHLAVDNDGSETIDSYEPEPVA
jgi:hypothetical protein